MTDCFCDYIMSAAPLTITRVLCAATPENHATAENALAIFDGYYPGPRVERIGCDTYTACLYLACLGRTALEASAREYLYRWSVALTSPVFGVPHPL